MSLTIVDATVESRNGDIPTLWTISQLAVTIVVVARYHSNIIKKGMIKVMRTLVKNYWSSIVFQEKKKKRDS